MAGKVATPIIGEPKFIKNISHLYYLSNGVWVPFPPWANFFLELGTILSCYENKSNRFISVITTPTRAFAASLIAAGVIVPRVGMVSHNLQSHISKLEMLSVGTPVLFRRGNLQFKGIYKGTTCGFGKRYFLINFQKGTEISIPYEDAFRIDISERQVEHLPNIQSGRLLHPPSNLVKQLFEPDLLNKFLIESRLECVILGQQKTFQQELCDFPIEYKEGDRMFDGKIIDLVRVKGAQFQPSDLSYRTYVLSATGKYNQHFTSKLNNYVTVFDGSLGFIKWREYFRNSNWIVVLDKTDRNFDLAVKEVNDEYIQNRVDKSVKLLIPNAPAGIEMMFFEEVI